MNPSVKLWTDHSQGVRRLILEATSRFLPWQHPATLVAACATCFQPDGVLFSGDCVLSRGTTAVHLDQGGDMAAYVASLQKLADQNANLLLSFHGTPVTDPAAKLAELIEHRNSRDQSILECLRDGVTEVDAMRERFTARPTLRNGAGTPHVSKSSPTSSS